MQRKEIIKFLQGKGVKILEINDVKYVDGSMFKQIPELKDITIGEASAIVNFLTGHMNMVSEPCSCITGPSCMSVEQAEYSFRWNLQEDLLTMNVDQFVKGTISKTVRF